jgi:Spy/CpxP family protein refolding chaperone
MSHGHLHGGMKHRPGIIPWLLQGVELTKEQRTQIRAIHKAHEATFTAIGGEIQEVRQAIARMIVHPEGVTAADLQPLSNKLTTLLGQYTQERLAMTLEMRAVLTAEQLAELAERHTKPEE